MVEKRQSSSGKVIWASSASRVETAPPGTPRKRRAAVELPSLRQGFLVAAAALYLAATALLVACLFPSYGHTVPALVHETAQTFTVLVPAACFLVTAVLLVLGSKNGVLARIGTAFGVAVTLLFTGFVVLQALAPIVKLGSRYAGPGVWILLFSPLPALAGLAVAIIETRHGRRLGRPQIPGPIAALVAVVATAGIAVAWVPFPYRIHYVIQDEQRAGNLKHAWEFAGPWEQVAAVIVVLVLISLVGLCVATWRPFMNAGAMALGFAVEMLSQAAVYIYQASVPFDPALVHATAAQFQELGASAAISFRPWFWIELSAVVLMLLIGAWYLLLREVPD